MEQHPDVVEAAVVAVLRMWGRDLSLDISVRDKVGQMDDSWLRPGI